MAATRLASMSYLNSFSMLAMESATDTPCSSFGNTPWYTSDGNGPKPILYGATLPVSAMPISVRPWKPPPKAMMPGRPVAARAIFTAFSTASAPVV
ncbi:hypothetical protein D3C85_1516730 [compost metagenome]